MVHVNMAGRADWYWSVFFFFQAEDGIRDLTVTGVQTCALPIWNMTEKNDQLQAAAAGDLGEQQHRCRAQCDPQPVPDPQRLHLEQRPAERHDQDRKSVV